jgi:hypothetical protein
MASLEEVLNNLRQEIDLPGRLDQFRETIGPGPTQALESFVPSVVGNIWGGFDDYVTDKMAPENFESEGARLRNILDVGLDIGGLYGGGKVLGAAATPVASAAAGAGRALSPVAKQLMDFAAQKTGAGGVKLAKTAWGNKGTTAALGALGLNLALPNSSSDKSQPQQQYTESAGPAAPDELTIDEIENAQMLREFIKMKAGDQLSPNVGRTYSKDAPGTADRKMQNLGYQDTGGGNYIPKQALAEAMLQSRLSKDPTKSQDNVRKLKKYQLERQDGYLENPSLSLKPRFAKLGEKFVGNEDLLARFQSIQDALGIAVTPEERDAFMQDPESVALLNQVNALRQKTEQPPQAQDDDTGWGTMAALLAALGIGGYAVTKGKVPKQLTNLLKKKAGGAVEVGGIK